MKAVECKDCNQICSSYCDKNILKHGKGKCVSFKPRPSFFKLGIKNGCSHYCDYRHECECGISSYKKCGTSCSHFETKEEYYERLTKRILSSIKHYREV